MKAPTIKPGPASSYAGPGETIREVSDGRGNGALISARATDDGLVIDVYNAGPKVEVRGPLTVEVLAVRDPDGPVELAVFVNGRPRDAHVVLVDPGAGTDSREAWRAQAAEVEGSPAFVDAAAAAFESWESAAEEHALSPWEG